VAGEGHTGAGEGERPAVIGLMPLMAGRLDEGLRSEIKGGGSRCGVKTSPGISRSEVGRRGVAGGNKRKWQRSAGGEEDETDSLGPLDRETRGRRLAQKARTKRENILPQIHHRHTG
jgi:hypothetical protein